jgi:GST-like protein
MGSTPYVGGGFGHFYAYAPMKIEYAIDRFTMETKRLLDVLDKRLADNRKRPAIYQSCTKAVQ